MLSDVMGFILMCTIPFIGGYVMAAVIDKVGK